MNRRFPGIAATAAATVMLAISGNAAEPAGDARDGFRIELSAGATHSDNAGRTDSAGESTETSFEAGLVAGVRQDRPRLSATLDADLRFMTHNYGDYPDQLNGGLTGRLQYELLNERIAWVVEDHFGQSLLNAQNTVTPGNTQNTNVFSTGPNFTLPLGQRTEMFVQGRWLTVSYQYSNFDSNRLSGMLGLERQIGERSSLSLAASTQHATFRDLPSDADYDIHSAYLQWQARGARTTLQARAGYSRVEDSLDSSSGTVFGLQLSRELTTRTSLALDAGRSYGNSADALVRDQDIGGVSAGGRPATASADPQRSDYATLSWILDAERSGLRAAMNWRREQHLRDTSGDRRALGASLQISRRISQRMEAEFHSGYNAEDFRLADVEFDEWNAGLGLAWSISRFVGISASWDHHVGSGDTALGADTREYSENRYSLRLNWTPRD